MSAAEAKTALEAMDPEARAALVEMVAEALVLAAQVVLEQIPSSRPCSNPSCVVTSCQAGRTLVSVLEAAKGIGLGGEGGS